MDYWSNLKELTMHSGKSKRAVCSIVLEDIRDFLVAFSIVVALIALAYMVLSILAQ